MLPSMFLSPSNLESLIFIHCEKKSIFYSLKKHFEILVILRNTEVFINIVNFDNTDWQNFYVF